MKIFKTDSELEKKVQRVESLMRELGLSINHTYNGLEIVHNGASYPIVDTEGHDTVQEFPRTFEHERIQFSQD